MKYEKITTDEQAAMLDARLRQYEAEHFAHATNVALLRASGADDEGTQQAIKDAEDAMATLDKAHANTKAEQGKLTPKKGK